MAGDGVVEGVVVCLNVMRGLCANLARQEIGVKRNVTCLRPQYDSKVMSRKSEATAVK